jgi:uncharacterized membrane protein
MVGVRLAVILGAAWLLGPFVARMVRPRIPAERELTASALLVAVVAWVVLFGAGVLRHISFHSKAWDLAIFDQVIWNLANGNGWECSVRGVQDLRGDHFEPILLLFVPLYKVFSHVGWLLGLQATALVGAVLLVWATYRTKLDETASFLLLCACFCYPPIAWLACADFHPIALAPFFIALGWWGRTRSVLPAFVAGLVGLSLCGEEGFIVAGWWGFWEFAVRSPWRRTRDENQWASLRMGWVGLGLCVALWAGFIYLSAVYIPSHRAEGEGYFYVHRYSYLGGSVVEIARNFFAAPLLWVPKLVEPRSIALLALYLAPLAFLPAFRPITLLLLLPTALYTLLSESDEQRSIFHQYTAIWIPFLLIAVGEALDRPEAGPSFQLKRASILLTAALLGLVAFSPLFGLSMHREWFLPEDWSAEAKGIVGTIAPSVSVSAPSALCPHLSHRRVLLLKPNSQWPGANQVLVLPDFPPRDSGGG